MKGMIAQGERLFLHSGYADLGSLTPQVFRADLLAFSVSRGEGRGDLT